MNKFYVLWYTGTCYPYHNVLIPHVYSEQNMYTCTHTFIISMYRVHVQCIHMYTTLVSSLARFPSYTVYTWHRSVNSRVQRLERAWVYLGILLYCTISPTNHDHCDGLKRLHERYFKWPSMQRWQYPIYNATIKP